MTTAEVSAERLPPCPFCGNATAPKVFPYSGEPYFPGYVVRCDASGWDGKPGRGCGAETGWAGTPAEAVAAWGRRSSVVTEGMSPEWIRDAAMNVMLATEVEEGIRILTAALSSQAQVEGASFQSRVAQAHIALFHDDPTDVVERRNRFYEEATEAAQALGMTEQDAHELVAYTFSRPVGEPEKEIGAAALTLASLCVIGGWNMMACAEADLASLQTPEKIAKVRAKRATRHGRGPLPGVLAGGALP
jgi:hypothetical protein